MARRTAGLTLSLTLVSLWAHGSWDASLFERRQTALERMGVPAEADVQGELRDWSGRQSRSSFEVALSLMDPQGELARYARWDSSRLTVFQDADEKRVHDFEVAFAPEGSVPRFPDPVGLLAQNEADQPLRGLRVALDPGHFGNAIDDDVGKYVESRGLRLREGTLTLQACLLTAAKLMALGVRREDILLTRPSAAPATDEPYDDFPLERYARRELLRQADESWFVSILRRAQGPSHLFDLLAGSRALQAIFPDRAREPRRWRGARTSYFALDAELGHRARMINAFEPDITVIIHFDASTGRLQRRQNHVKAFVPGNWLPQELGTRDERYSLVRRALDTEGWLRSVRLASAVVRGVSRATGVGLSEAYASDRGRAVAAGIYTRNLALNRLATGTGALVYLEALFYDHTAEFPRLARQTERAAFDGVPFNHSARVEDVADGVVDGVRDYVTAILAEEAGNSER